MNIVICLIMKRYASLYEKLPIGAAVERDREIASAVLRAGRALVQRIVLLYVIRTKKVDATNFTWL